MIFPDDFWDLMDERDATVRAEKATSLKFTN